MFCNTNRFMVNNTEDCGWILKAPYVQNQAGFRIRTIKKIDDLDDILLRRIYESPSSCFNKINLFAPDVFDYLILQPKMRKKNESKVVLLNGKAQYIVSASSSGLTGMYSQDRIFSFAENAFSHLCDVTEGAFLCDGLTRVDIFSNKDGNLVVNEFENLDAQYSKLDSGISEARVKVFLEGYYFNKVAEIIKEIAF